MSTIEQSLERIDSRLEHVEQELGQLRSEMATKQELGQLRSEMATKQELGQLRSETKQELQQLRSEMATKQELQQGLQQLRSEMATKQELQRGLGQLREENRRGQLELYATLREEIHASERRLRHDLGQDMASHLGAMQEWLSTQIQILSERFVTLDQLRPLLER